MYSVLTKLSEYTWFYISKKITSHTFLFVLKIVERLFSVSLRKSYETNYSRRREGRIFIPPS